MLGGFHQVPPSTRPGWIVQVTSRFRHTWYVVVTPVAETHETRVWLTEEVPWDQWAGQIGRASNIYDGDDPQAALLQKVQAKRRLDRESAVGEDALKAMREEWR